MDYLQDQSCGNVYFYLRPKTLGITSILNQVNTRGLLGTKSSSPLGVSECQLQIVIKNFKNCSEIFWGSQGHPRKFPRAFSKANKELLRNPQIFPQVLQKNFQGTPYTCARGVVLYTIYTDTRKSPKSMLTTLGAIFQG